MINEKRLVRHLKQAYKEGGYKIVERKGMTTVETDSLCVIVPTKDLPRPVLGIIAEHAGYIPEETAISVAYGQDNQTIMDSTLWYGAALDGYNDGEAVPTPLTWGRMHLYQTKNLQVFGIDLVMLGVVDAKKPVINSRNGVAIYHDMTATVVLQAITKKDNAQLEELEGYRWVPDE